MTRLHSCKYSKAARALQSLLSSRSPDRPSSHSVWKLAKASITIIEITLDTIITWSPTPAGSCRGASRHQPQVFVQSPNLKYCKQLKLWKTIHFLACMQKNRLLLNCCYWNVTNWRGVNLTIGMVRNIPFRDIENDMLDWSSNTLEPPNVPDWQYFWL